MTDRTTPCEAVRPNGPDWKGIAGRLMATLEEIREGAVTSLAEYRAAVKR